MMTAPQERILRGPPPADTYVTDRFDQYARRLVAPAADAPSRPPTPSRPRARPGHRPVRGLLGLLAAGRALRAALETAVESGGKRMMTADEPRVFEDATERAARILARALAEAQRTLSSREVPSSPFEHEAAHLRDVADRLDSAARALGGQVERLAGLLERLEQRQPAPAPEPLSRPGWAGPPPSQEPSFPLGEVITLVVSAVPGFQGLMDVQRALSGLNGVEGASVRRYQGGEATIELVLARPMTAGDLASGIRDATHHRIVVEDAQPDTLQLHLRCLAADD